MTERRYDEREVEAIFRDATEGRAARPAAVNTTFTLAELQEIGREAGISPESVAIAAASLDVRADSGRRTLLGLPVGVSHTVELGRLLSDDEWHRLVSRMRAEFDAQGVSG